MSTQAGTMKMLVALGATENNAELYRQAVSYAKKMGGELYPIHIIEELPKISFYMDAYELWIAFRDLAIKESMAKVAGMIRDYSAGSEITPIIEVGDVAQKVAEVAERLQADLIIVGNHGYHGIQRALHANRCEAILRATRVPVLALYIPAK